MAAPTTTSALAPEVEHSHASVNEPSMEDILASIRRIIAEDQSNNLGRSSLGGLTRRQPASPVPAQEVAPSPPEDVSAASAPLEPAFHEPPHAQAFDGADEPPAELPHPVMEEAPVAESMAAPQFEMPEASETDTRMDHHQADEPHPQFGPLMTDEAAEPLMSPLAGASITSSFQTLAESVMLQDPGLIERVMRESMRPLLKAWLDDHLPSIVERLVRTEIERVARGGRARNA